MNDYEITFAVAAVVVLLLALIQIYQEAFRLVILETRWKLNEWRWSIAAAVAACLPRWLVYAACIRLVAHATTGRYGNTLVPGLTAMDALKRWESSNE